MHIWCSIASCIVMLHVLIAWATLWSAMISSISFQSIFFWWSLMDSRGAHCGARYAQRIRMLRYVFWAGPSAAVGWRPFLPTSSNSCAWHEHATGGSWNAPLWFFCAILSTAHLKQIRKAWCISHLPKDWAEFSNSPWALPFFQIWNFKPSSSKEGQSSKYPRPNKGFISLEATCRCHSSA